MSEDTHTRATDQSHTTLVTRLSIILEELEELKKRSVTTVTLSAKVEDVVMKRAIPAMVEAVRLEFAEGFRHFIPIMVEEVLKKLGCSSISRPLPHYGPYHVKSSASKSLKLVFVGTLPDTLLTFNNIQDEGASLQVELQDSSGSRVKVGLEASVKIKIVVLDGDFEVEDTDDWTHRDFDKNVAQPRKDKGPLLKGKCEIFMSNGVAGIGDIAFTDNSKSMRNGKFRLGARAVKGRPPGVEIREAVSDAFKVKERRVKFYRKHRSPSPEDGTNCLKNIGKTLCQKLADREIHTVKDFLQLYHTNANELRNIVQVAENKWSELVKNAELCSLSDEYYQYHDEESGVEILLDCVFNVARVLFNDRVSQRYADLAEPEKKLVNKIRLAAYEKRKDLPRICSPTIPTSMQAESLCRSIIPHLNSDHVDARTTDTSRLMPSMDLDINSRITSNQTEKDLLPNRSSEGSTAGRELLSLMPSEPGMPADQTHDSNPQHQSSITLPTSSSFLGSDGYMNGQFRLGPASDTGVALCSTNVPEDSMSKCDVEFKRPRLG